jgi:hypothetical protein
VEFIVTNYGPTHAFNVRLFVSYILTESTTPVILPELQEIQILSTMRADGKDSRPSIRLNIRNSLDQLGALVGGTKSLQIGGKLTYTDVFGEERKTNFRFINRIHNERTEWVQHGLPADNETT